MKDFHDLLINRRSIRRYTEQLIDANSVKLILEAALMAPTSKNSRSWSFIVIDNRETLDKLAQCKPAGATPLTNAPLAIVVCGDSRLSDPWIEDASVAATFMQLQAADLNLGSCWVQIRGRFTADGISSEEYIQELLGIPEEISVLCIVTFGHKNEERRLKDTTRLPWEKVSIGRWGSVE